ncbi:MAG: PEP-CTERM sorting domain-containing protein [Chloroflexi bacterium]|nr:PEP-CTERM sorting domain-containing protein [Chloroflexota bacterium]
MVPPIVPEPATLLLVGGGMAVLAGYANLRRRTSPGARR